MDEITSFRQLIDNAKKEQELQSYLEEHPYLFLDLLMSPNATIISQFSFGQDFRCDFAFVHSNSGGNFLNLIELEHPKANIFNCDGSFSQQFNLALQQIHDWAAWCRAHQEFIMRQIKPLIKYLKSDNLYVNGLLVIGRRNELSNRQKQERFEARLHDLPRGLQFRTYDGFVKRLEDCKNWMKEGYRSVRCLRYKKQGFVET